MFNNDNLSKLSDKLLVPLYLYNSDEKKTTSINNGKQANVETPSWMQSLVESGSSRKMFQKNSETIVYHCFKVSDVDYLLFQDNQEQIKLSGLISHFFDNNVAEGGGKPSINEDAEEYKRLLVKAKEIQAELRQELRKRDLALNDSQEKLMKTSKELIELKVKAAEQVKLNKELNEALFTNIQQIRRMKADTDYMNFQKLKQVNAELREELNKVMYNTAQSGDKSGKIRKALEDTVVMLRNQIEAGKLDQGELSRMVTGLSTADLGLSLPVSKMPTFQDPSAQLIANQQVTAMPKFQDTMNADVHLDSLTQFKGEKGSSQVGQVSQFQGVKDNTQIDQLTQFKGEKGNSQVGQVSQFQGVKGNTQIGQLSQFKGGKESNQVGQLSQIDPNLLKNRDEIENLSEVEERVLRERQEIEKLSQVTEKALKKSAVGATTTFLKPPVVPAAPLVAKFVEVSDIKPATFDDIINVLNDAIDRNDSSNVNVEMLSKIVPMGNKEAVAKYPSTGLRTVKSALIGLSRANKLSGMQMNILKTALGLK